MPGTSPTRRQPEVSPTRERSLSVEARGTPEEDGPDPEVPDPESGSTELEGSGFAGNSESPSPVSDSEPAPGIIVREEKEGGHSLELPESVTEATFDTTG